MFCGTDTTPGGGLMVVVAGESTRVMEGGAAVEKWSLWRWSEQAPAWQDLSPQDGPAPLDVYRLSGAAADSLWAVGDGVVLRSRGGRFELVAQNPAAEMARLLGAWQSRPGEVFVAGAYGTLLRYRP